MPYCAFGAKRHGTGKNSDTVSVLYLSNRSILLKMYHRFNLYMPVWAGDRSKLRVGYRVTVIHYKYTFTWPTVVSYKSEPSGRILVTWAALRPSCFVPGAKWYKLTSSMWTLEALSFLFFFWSRKYIVKLCNHQIYQQINCIVNMWYKVLLCFPVKFYFGVLILNTSSSETISKIRI